MEFRVLGPVEISGADGRTQARGDRQQALLCALLMQADRIVPMEQLIDAVWGEDPPAAATAAVHSLVSRLRRALATAEADGDQRLVALASGYRLKVEPGELDLAVFREHVERGRTAAASGHLMEAARELNAGLAEWRGHALDGVPGHVAEAHATRLQEEHLAATEERIGVDLALGKHTELVSELRGLVNEHPLRERLHSHLMLALFRAGQQVEALQAFQDTRRTLIDGLGIEPGLELRDLHQRILRGDPGLGAPHAQPQPVRLDTRPRRNDLPADIGDFTGRESELRQLLTTLSHGDTAVMISINGMAGVGKTVLAVHAAHRLSDRYPDAQLYIDLHAHTAGQSPTEPGDALEALLRAMGVPGEKIPDATPERAALWRAELANRRVLVVLDNAASAAQVRPLLPGTAGCLALVTSRRRLIDLDNARTVTLELLSPDEAVDMFARVVGDARPAVEAESAKEVVQLCGYLPLAIRIAAARLHSRSTWSISYLAERLREGQKRLTELSAGDRSVTAAFELSYRHLTAEQQRVFRLMSVHAGAEFDAYATAAVTDIDLDKAERLLEDLVDVHLLHQPAPGRFRFHDLIRAHAAATAAAEDSAADRHEATTRLLDYYLHTAEQATRQIHSSGYRVELGITRRPVHVPKVDTYKKALDWLEAERDNLVAMVTAAAENGWHTHAWQLPHSLWYFFLIRGYAYDWIATHRLALAAARQLHDQAAEAETLHNLGTACWRAGYLDEALEHCQRALELYQAAGDSRGEGQAHSRFGLIYSRLGRIEEALECYERGLPFQREGGDQWTEGITLTNLGFSYAWAGRENQAHDFYHQALTLVREIEDPWVESCTRGHLGTFYRDLGRYADAEDHHHRGLEIKREIGDRGAESDLLSDLGETYLAAGRIEQAKSVFEQALALGVDVHDRYQQARAHDGLGYAVRDSDSSASAEHWRRALEIFAELGVPEADRVRKQLDGLESSTRTSSRQR